MADPVEVDKEFERRLAAVLPAEFDPASIVTLLMSLISQCLNPSAERTIVAGPPPATPEDMVSRIRNMTWVQRGGLTNRLSDHYEDKEGLRRRQAMKKAMTAVAGIEQIAKESTEAEQLAAAERAMEVSNPDYQWI